MAEPTTNYMPWGGAYRWQSASYIVIVSRICGSVLTGDAEAHGLALVHSSFCGVAIYIYAIYICYIYIAYFCQRKVLDLPANLNCFMQRKAANF